MLPASNEAAAGSAKPCLVSVIIPTYNRREMVQVAIRSVLDQTVEVEDIIVVDDGSSDGTGEALTAAFGDRIRYVYQSNTGVSGARNHGMRLARGRFFTLLDSDDVWDPRKTEMQLKWLQERPDFGMVVCDSGLVGPKHEPLGVFKRRPFMPEDGNVLKWVLLEPVLIPASLMMRREVYEDVGGFDESLPTAEDLDYNIRVASRWPIGSIDEPLVTCMRGHEGLSELSRTNDDFVRVILRAVESARGKVDDAWLRRARYVAFERNTRGMIYSYRWRDALRLSGDAWREAPDWSCKRRLLGLSWLAARRWVNQVRTQGASRKSA